MSTWKDSTSQSVGVDKIANVSSYVKHENAAATSPIDSFYQQTQSIMSVATPISLGANDWIGALYAIAVVSATENYFRQIFSSVLKICTDSQKHASSNTISLGSVIWHPKNGVERGAFEHISFASSENLISAARKFIDIDLKQKGMQSILDEFDTVCEIRHGIVHSDRVLAGKNGMKLKLSPTENVTRIHIKYAELQELSAVCTNLVVTLNKILFEEVSKRWATSWRKSPSWIPEKANNRFKEIWLLFHSGIDETNGTIPLKCTWLKCRNLISKEFNI